MPMLLSMVHHAQEVPHGSRSRWHAAFLRFAEYTDETTLLVHLHIAGVSRIIDWPRFFAELCGDELLQKHQETYSRGQTEANSARPEAEKGFPLVHGHALLGLWSALEAMVEDAIVAWIIDKPETLQSADFAKIRVPLAEFSRMDAEDQALYLVSEVQRDSKLAQGITRFERLFDAVGLGGSVNEEVRKAIFEAQQVRNALAHRGGFADRRLVEACPWLELNPGHRLSVTHRKFLYYMQAMRMYAIDLLNRCYLHDGIDPITAVLDPLSAFLEEPSQPETTSDLTSSVSAAIAAEHSAPSS